MVKLNLLTENENKVLNKKLENKKLTQVESNYLSRSIRPKLKEAEKLKTIDITSILQKIEYNQKGKSIELKIKNLIKEKIKSLDSIIIYGSAVQTNYFSYNDIDVLVITEKKTWKKEKDKYALVKEIKETAKGLWLVLDVQILTKESFYKEYSSSPDLIYQLKDSKIIYGNIKIPKEIALSKLNLEMKLDWSNLDDVNPNGLEIYNAIRNALLVKLILNKTIDNQKLKQFLLDEIGKNLSEKLKNNIASIVEKKLATNYLKELSDNIRKEIRGEKWEKIEL